MKLTSILMALIGIAFAGGSAFLANDVMQTRSNQALAAQDTQLVEIMIATQNIPFGQEIEPHMVSKRAWPRDALPQGAFTDVSQLIPGAGQELRSARGPIMSGQPIMATQVSDFGEKITIVQAISANGRAMAITVSAATSAGGFVTPGDYVDIVMIEGGGGDMRALTLLQNIRIIAVDQNANEQSDMPQVSRTVTVDVTREQAQTLTLAQQAGRLSLLLRAFGTETDEPLPSVRLSDMMNEDSPVLTASTQPRTVTIRRGTAVETITARESN